MSEKTDQYLHELTGQEREELFQLGRELFDCPELGFKEVKSSQILTSFLEKNRISCQSGLSLTGIKATIGDHGYHIGLVADMDALPLLEDGGCIHSCGHSIQTTVMAYALKLINDSGILSKTGGRVSLIATPAEEFIDFSYREELKRQGKIQYFSGKQNMIRDGVFDDVDCAISAHINGEKDTLFDVGSTLAGFTVRKVTIKGVAAHSGAAPHLGKNAFHGASLCMEAIAFLKDRFPAEAGIQIHPVIHHMTGGVNIIPDQVILETYIRANCLESLMEAQTMFDTCVTHCCMALGLECQIEETPGYMPLSQSAEINQVIYRHMREICDDDAIIKHVVSGASGDIGDLSYLMPAVQFGFSGVEGRIHSTSFSIKNEEHVYVNTVKVIVNTVIDLLSDKSLQVKYEDYQKRKEFYFKNWLYENKRS